MANDGSVQFVPKLDSRAPRAQVRSHYLYAFADPFLIGVNGMMRYISGNAASRSGYGPPSNTRSPCQQALLTNTKDSTITFPLA